MARALSLKSSIVEPERVWVILRVSQYVRHLALPCYFTSEKAALAYIKRSSNKIPEVLKGCTVQAITLRSE